MCYTIKKARINSRNQIIITIKSGEAEIFDGDYVIIEKLKLERSNNNGSV